MSDKRKEKEKERREKQLGEREGGRQTWGRKNKEERSIGRGSEAEWRKRRRRRG